MLASMSTAGGNSANDVVGSMQYDPKVHRKSLEDPSRTFRRSSIPFVDRRPAVRFIRSVDQRTASFVYPVGVGLKDDDNSQKKTILKKTNFPILVDANELGIQSDKSASQQSTNEELDNCRYKTGIIMERLLKSERIARGGMDVLTFPTCTRRVDPLSRYMGCMAICICSVGVYTTTEEYLTEVRRKSTEKKHQTELRTFVDIAYEMQLEAVSLHSTAKKFLALAKHRHKEWDELLKRNLEFRIDQTKLSYPIYTHKRMPESVTLFEDTLEEGDRYNLEGCVRVCRKYQDGIISLLCEGINLDKCETVNLQESPMDMQSEIVSIVTSHAKDLLFYSNNCLSQGLEVLQDHEIDDAFSMVQRKINSLEYDDYFDPLCAMDLKNALAELVARKSELLNTAEQIMEHCKWILNFTKAFHRYTRHSFKGGGPSGTGVCCCVSVRAPSKRKLLSLLGIVSVDDIMILLPLSCDIAEKIFQARPIDDNNPDDLDNCVSKDAP